ncbi:sugar phosphate nucleotidyltransferase [Halobaculum sp. MBLA0147]|uniref:sugar phosphate nucleotidyltransferase n=1 Tax=Halobaculum sp. MBLA0147 TaxID=3079934 RepID=UPI003524853A
MEAVVLAGGYATRMWPITRHRPKMFLPLGEETVIDGVFADLEADDRIDEVYVSTNERFADEFEAYLADSAFEKPQVSVEDTTAESEKFGVVGALAQLIDREDVDDDLLVIAGDNLLSFDVAEFVDFFVDAGTPTLAAYDVGSRERAKSYGLVELDGTEVVDFQEKPDDPNSTLVSIACYAFPRDTLPSFDTYLSNDNNPDEPGWFVQWLQSRQSVNAFTFDGAWYDIGTADAYLDAVAHALDGDTLVADDATVEDSELGENVHVMSGAEVVDASLSNTVVFDDARIADSTLERSVVDEAATVEDLDLRETLLGQHSRLVGN